MTRQKTSQRSLELCLTFLCAVSQILHLRLCLFLGRKRVCLGRLLISLKSRSLWTSENAAPIVRGRVFPESEVSNAMIQDFCYSRTYVDDSVRFLIFSCFGTLCCGGFVRGSAGGLIGIATTAYTHHFVLQSLLLLFGCFVPCGIVCFALVSAFACEFGWAGFERVQTCGEIVLFGGHHHPVVAFGFAGGGFVVVVSMGRTL